MISWAAPASCSWLTPLIFFTVASTFRHQMYNGNNHFLQGDATVLEGVFIIIHVIVIVVRIGEEIIFHCKHITGGDIELRKLGIFRYVDLENLYRFNITNFDL